MPHLVLLLIPGSFILFMMVVVIWFGDDVVEEKLNSVLGRGRQLWSKLWYLSFGRLLYMLSIGWQGCIRSFSKLRFNSSSFTKLSMIRLTHARLGLTNLLLNNPNHKQTESLLQNLTLMNSTKNKAPDQKGIRDIIDEVLENDLDG